jgi:hypothetical protein
VLGELRLTVDGRVSEIIPFALKIELILYEIVYKEY